MSLLEKIGVYLYLVAIIHICGLQAYAFITNQHKIRVGKRLYRYQVYAVTLWSIVLLVTLFYSEVIN